MDNCTTCGAEVSAAAAFCSRCGAAHTPAVAQPAPTQPQAATPPPPPAPGPPSAVTPPPAPVSASPPPAPLHGSGQVPVQVNVPAWLGIDWAAPLALSVIALVVGLVLQLGTSLLLLLTGAIGGSADPEVLYQGPITFWVVFHGGVRGGGAVGAAGAFGDLTASGIMWVVLGLWLALRLGGTLTRGLVEIGASPRLTVIIRAAKGAFIYAVIVLIVTLVAGPVAGLSGATNPAAAFFLSLLMAFLAMVWLFAKSSGLTLAHALGLPSTIRAPGLLTGAWVGARRTLLIAVLGTWVFTLLAMSLEVFTVDSSSFGFATDFSDKLSLWLLVVTTGLVLFVIDFVLLGFLEMLKLLIGVPFGTALVDLPAWRFVGLVVPVLAFAIGGSAAAKSMQMRTQLDGIKAGLLVGPLAGAALFAFSLFYASQTGTVVAVALLTPMLWGIISAIAGMYAAQQAGLPRGFQVQMPTAPAAAGTETAPCAQCKTPNPVGAAFCTGCGAHLASPG